MDIDLTKLYAPFPPEKTHWRLGATNSDKTKGVALAYIDARDVMARLDEVCGPENWQCDYPHAVAKTCCRIGVKVGDEWVWKSNGSGDTDVEGQKGAFSDAFKRAAVLWGIGRYLYDLKSPWVEIEQRGRSYVIKQSEMARLNGLLPGRKSKETFGGPLTKTELKAKSREFAGDLAACTDEDALAGVLEGYKDILAQMERDLPDWHEKAEHAIETKRNELQERAA